MDEGSSWVLELEEALLDEAPPDQLKLLLVKRMRVVMSSSTCPRTSLTPSFENIS